MRDKLRVIASRFAKLAVTAGCTWIFVHYGIHMPAWLRSIFEEAIAAVSLAATLGLFAHFGVAIKLNPDDVVDPQAAALGKAKRRQRKATRATEERIQKAGVNAVELPPLDKVPASEKGL